MKKIPRLPLRRRLIEPESRSGLFGKEKNLLPLPDIEELFLGRLASSLVSLALLSHVLSLVFVG